MILFFIWSRQTFAIDSDALDLYMAVGNLCSNKGQYLFGFELG